MGLAEIELEIRSFGEKANGGKLTIDDMKGGTFTISNGGVYGSLLSTPILNPPQTAVLGMHKIQERPMVVNGEIKALPVMYLALSYDHQMLDGKEAVQFLVTIKDLAQDGMTCCLVTHEMGFAKEIADHIYFTDRGIIVEHGPPKTFFNDAKDPRTKEFLSQIL